MKLHYGKLTIAAFSSTTAQTGYPAQNLGLESISRPWRATGVGATDVILTLPAVATIQTLAVHDVNFATAQVYKSVDGGVWVLVGTLTTYADRHGRRRGSITINAAGQLAVKISIGAGAATDGLTYWRGGAADLFGSVLTPSAAVRYGYKVRTRRPRASTELPNGLTAVATIGANIDRIELTFERINSEVVDDIIQKASVGTCWLDIGLSNYPEQQWPVRLLEQDLEEGFENKNLSAMVVPVTEVV